ncbi:lysM and putative peptidoglycan-binding domain-containing protein 1 [Mantella aurantiaca]
MASSPGGTGLLRGTRTRSYGSLVQTPYSPARIRKVEHLVQPGDTLQGLALKYGVSMEQIKRANRLYTNDSIFLKKYLSIPVLSEQPELTNGGGLQEEAGGAEESGEGSAAGQPVREEKSRLHHSSSHAERRDEVSASDFMTKLDTRIRVSKRAAVKKIRAGESGEFPHHCTDMASSPHSRVIFRGTRTRSYGSLVQTPYSPARIRKVEHLVQPGDTLQGLALKYGVSMEQIKRANRLYTNDSIFLKKYLSIPVLSEQPELTNGGGLQEEVGGAGESGEGSAAGQPVREEKSRLHHSSSHAERRDEVSASDFMTKLDTRIRVSKRAAVKKIRAGESGVGEEDAAAVAAVAVVGYQNPRFGRSGEGSPKTQQRSLLGPLPLTVTPRASTLRDREDEIFKL